MKKSCPCCSRRDALRLGAMGAASLVLAPALGGCGGSDLSELERDIVISLSDYPALAEVGGAARISDPGFPYDIWVIREQQDDYRALSSECNHAQCEVDKKGDAFVCPCHGSTFALDGNKTRGPATADLLNFDTQLTGSLLTIKADA